MIINVCIYESYNLEFLYEEAKAISHFQITVVYSYITETKRKRRWLLMKKFIWRGAHCSEEFSICWKTQWCIYLRL